MRTVAVSGFQSEVSASHYVLPMLALGAPTGSPLSGLRTVTTFGVKRAPKGSLAFDTDMGLYYSTVTTGPTITANYFTDAAGTQSAGSLKATLENATTFNTSYTSYPQTIDISANVTAGNIVANGTVKIGFTDSAGSNTLVGTINAPQKGISAQLNMSLNATGTVGGTITVVQNGMTSVVSNLTGDISTGFNGSVVVSPGNLKGTATLNLISEAFTLHLSDGTTIGDTTATPITLSTTYNDGSTLTLQTPVTVAVDGSGTSSSGATSTGTTSTGTTSTGTTGTGSTGGGGISNYTITPVSGSPATIDQVTSNGHMLGKVGSNGIYQYYYWDTPTSSAQAIATDSTLIDYTVSGVNTQGNLVGYAQDRTKTTDLGNPLLYFLYWQSASSQPVRIAIPNFTPINFSGSNYPGGARASILSDGYIILQGSDETINASVLLPNAQQTWVYSSPTDPAPYRVAGFAVYSTSDNGSALATPTSGTPSDGITVLAQLAPNPSSFIVPGTATPSSKSARLGADGTVSVNDAGLSKAWISHGPSYSDQVFPSVSGLNISSSGGIVITQVTPSGALLGTRLQDNNGGAVGCYWTSPSAVPQTFGLYYPQFLTSNGTIIAFSSGYKVLTPK